MTISSTTNRWEYNGDGVTVAFPYTNLIFASADLKVYKDGTLLGAGYTVSGVGVVAGGNVTFSVAPVAGTKNVVIERDLAYEQTTSLPSGGPFPAKSVERIGDRVTILAQQLLAALARTVRKAATDTAGADVTLPTPAASALLAWNDTGTGLANVAAADVGLTPVSPFAATLLDDADAAAALTTLGALSDAAGAVPFSSLDQDGIAGLTEVVVTASDIVVFADVTAANVMRRDTVQGILDLVPAPTSVDEQTFNANDTWTKPAAGTIARVRAWGAGGSGGHRNGTASVEAGGGAGGAYAEKWFLLSDLGATETVTIGAGGAAVGTADASGNAGGNTTFGAHLTGYGGGGGANSASGAGGGGGGGISGAGATAVGTAAGAAGAPGTPLTSAGGSSAAPTPTPGYWDGAGGGGGGAGDQASPGVGASSVNGGAGGGGCTNTAAAGGVSTNGGAGGSGTSNGNGIAGTAPGGGGGASTGVFVSGAGAAGRVVVTVF